MEEFITACPRNCYSTCSFRVSVENNTIKRISPYSKNLATPEGPCIKGLSYIERAHSPHRILHPLLRLKDGTFTKIKIREAFEIISEKLLKIKSESGSESILWLKGSGMSGLTNEIGHSFWKTFGGVTITYGNLCWPAGLEAVRLTLGSVKHNVPWDTENAGIIVIWGKNPAETNIQEMAFIGKARMKGARIIVIDPRRTLTADKADVLYMIKPGTDAALALAIAWVLVSENLTDNGFIKKYVTGFEEYKANSLITPAEAEKICGIPGGEITALARIIGSKVPVMFLPGYGLQRYTNGGQTIRAILSLAVITGNIGKPGTGFNYANLQSYIYDETKEPLSYFPDPVKDHPFRRTVSMARLGVDILRTRDPGIRCIWVERGNPLLQSPDTTAVAKAFLNSDFTVVVEQFMTDTAKYADIVLPAKDMFEQSDIIGSYWSPYVQFKPKVLEPEGDVMPESEIYYHLSQLMGMKIPFGSIPEPGNENIEKWLEKRIAGEGWPVLDDLRKGPVLAPGLQQIAYEDYLFETPSRKIELYSKEISEKWNTSPVPVYVPVRNEKGIEDKYPLVFISPNTGSRIHSQFGNLDIIGKNAELPAFELSLSDAEERNINQGDTIKVYNDAGSIVCIARVTGRVAPGIVILPNGIWLNENGGGNTLTLPAETDIGFGAAFHGNRVEVEKINV
jgi:anaerobic selenocysteine-containing dehydrogenase